MRYLRIAIVGVMTGLALSSCSQMSKLLKSGDSEAIYQQGLTDYYARKYRNAVIYFGAVQNDYFTTDRYDTILFYSGKALYNMGDYRTAAEYMDIYRKDYGRRNFSEEAEYLLPMSYYHLSRPAERDQSETYQAMSAFNDYLNRYPESIKAEDIKLILEELQLKLYEKEFINSSLYVKLERYPSAVAALRNALKETPETPYREEMMFLICKSWYNYARNSIPQRKLDRYMRMVDSYYNYMNEYPESNRYRRDLDKMFQESRFYIDRNQQATMDLERNRIEIDTRKIMIRQQRADLREIKDPIEREAARRQLKEERAALKQQERQIKQEARQLRKATSRKNLKTQAENEAWELQNRQLLDE